MLRLCSDNGSTYPVAILPADDAALDQQRFERAHKLYIAIEVEPAVRPQRFETHEVRLHSAVVTQLEELARNGPVCSIAWRLICAMLPASSIREHRLP
jgi:hypothetical protein